MYHLRLLQVSDAAALADYHRRNEEFHREWSPVPPAGFFDVAYQRRRLEASLQLRLHEQEFRFGIFHKDELELLVGSINLNAIERGVFQNGRLGYSIDRDHGGCGVMTANVAEVVRYAFGRLGLHRVEANAMPRNIASRRVLEKCGFRKVGHSPKMVKINGVWEDHDMFMVLAE